MAVKKKEEKKYTKVKFDSKEFNLKDNVFRFEVDLYVWKYPEKYKKLTEWWEWVTAWCNWYYVVILRHNDMSTLVHELNHVVQLRLEECWVKDKETHSYLLQCLVNKVLDKEPNYFKYISLDYYLNTPTELQ